MTERVFINEKNMATFMCPECGKVRTVDVSNYMDFDKAIKVKCKCKCGHVYSVILERRKYYRRHTNLPGIFILEANLPGFAFNEKLKQKGLIIVEDISLSGVRFRFNSTQQLKINAGDKLVLEFNLDDSKRTLIRKEVVVKRKVNGAIGAEYCRRDPDDKYDKAIGFYMFS